MNYIYILFTGNMLALMIVFNGLIGKAAGNYASSVIIHFIGLMGVIMVMLFTKSKLNKLKGIPLYMYTGGLIGIITVLFTNISYSYLEVSLIVALGLLGQSVTSIIIDHFGCFNLPIKRFDKKKYAGLAMITLGIFIMMLV